MADFENLKVGERIKALRQQRGWSAERVAKESPYPLDRTAIWKIENGRRRLQLEEAVALARVFRVPLERLIDSDQDSLESGDAGNKPVESESFAAEPAEPLPDGRPRRAELDELVGGLTSARGPYFWLVTAPTGFGKTALLHDLRAELEQEHEWVTSLVDVRGQASEFRDNPTALLARLTDVVLPDEDNHLSGRETSSGMADNEVAGAYRVAAQHVSKQGKPLLCALDGAELLSQPSIRSLRIALNRVSGLVDGAGNPDVRLAFVVASRLDKGWRGVRIQPQLSMLPLPELGVDAVEKRLRDAAGEVRAANITADRFRGTASLIHQVIAGVPSLLQPVLDWIEDEQWMDIYRLRDRAVFEPIVEDFISNRLLAADSLFPQEDTASEAGEAVIRKAVGSLVRYRFFTEAHVKRHLESDEGLKLAFDRFGGESKDLWAALSGTALLARPLNEPWQAFHPAVRRLLFRYFYATDEERAQAHKEASDFIAGWVAKQSGIDQVIGLIEGLWHDAEVLRYQDADRPAGQLRHKAAKLYEAVRQSEAYSATELRNYAADLIIADVELRESIGGSADLAEELADMMAAER